MKVTVKEIQGRKALKEFVRFPNIMYKDSEWYVPQLEKDDLDTLDKNVNHAFEVCESAYWMAYDEKGKAVGRIAGIINRAYNEKIGRKQARFGLVDFIDDADVVKTLVDTVENWARAKGMTEMNGPLGFLEFDPSGILVEGFDQLPTAVEKYNYPYYEPRLLEQGYVKDVDWIESLVMVPDEAPENYIRASKMVLERYDLRVVKMKSQKQIMLYIDGCIDLLNRAYGFLHGFSELTDGQIDDLKNHFVPLINPELVGLVVDRNDRVVAFNFCMLSMVRALQKAKGHMFPFGWYHFMKAMRKNDRAEVLLIAIEDEYRNKGLNAVLYCAMHPAFVKYGVKVLETTRELESNRNVQNLMRSFEFRTVKRSRCYIKSLE